MHCIYYFVNYDLIIVTGILFTYVLVFCYLNFDIVIVLVLMTPPCPFDSVVIVKKGCCYNVY